MKKIKNWKILLSLAAIFLLMPAAALAYEIKGGEVITISENEIIEDDLLIAGANVRINGTINGDVKTAGSIIEINGKVNGDVIAAGSQIMVRGEVADDLIAAGGQVNLENRIGDNTIIFGGVAGIAKNASIGRDLLAFGGMVNLDGEVGRNVKASVGSMNISNRVGGNIEGEFEQLVLSSNARVEGNLKYKAEREAEIMSGAEIVGATEWTPIKADKRIKADRDYGIFSFTGTRLVRNVLSMLGLLLVGIIVVLAFSREYKNIVEKLNSNPAKSFGWGLILFFLTPIIIVVSLATIIGIPLALIIAALYGVSLYIAKLIVSLFLGEWIIKSLSSKKEVSQIWSLILGIIVISIIFIIPFVGWLAKLIVLIFGLGALFIVAKEYFNKRKSSTKIK